MKTLKTIAAALLIAFSFSAFAGDETAKEKLEMNCALKTYIQAVAEGKITPLPEVLDKDIKFTSTRGEKIVHHSRAEMLSGLFLFIRVRNHDLFKFAEYFFLAFVDVKDV